MVDSGVLVLLQVRELFLAHVNHDDGVDRRGKLCNNLKSSVIVCQEKAYETKRINDQIR